MDEVFTKPRGSVIESSRGFSVETLGRSGMRYTEGDRFISIDSEGLSTSGIYMVPWSIRFWEGSDPDLVSDVDRDRIVANIVRAFSACGQALQVSGPPISWEDLGMRPRGWRPGGGGGLEAGQEACARQPGSSTDV